MREEISKCAKCGLTGSYRSLDLHGGECKFCRNFQKRSFPGENRLLKDLDLQPDEKIGVTVSGGKDSIYMWGVLTELLGADHILALTYYRPYITSEVALDNVKKTKNILGTDLLICTDTDAYARFRRNLEILLEDPKPEAVRVLLCAGCRFGITERLYREGQKRNVRKFFSGASYLELAPFKEELIEARSPRRNSDEGLERIIMDYPSMDYGDNLEIIRRDHHYKYKSNETERGQLKVGSEIRLFDFDDYFENDPDRIERIVMQKYGWQKTDRSWHFDCPIEDIKDVFYYGLLGYTEMDFRTAAMVRYDLLTKEQAHRIIAAEADKLANSYPKMVRILKRHQLEHRMPQLDALYRESPWLIFPVEKNMGAEEIG